MARSRSRIGVALAMACLVGAAIPGGRAEAAVSRIGLEDCHLTVHFISEEDGRRMHREGWLPDTYTPAPSYLGPFTGSLGIWVFDCPTTSIDDVGAGDAIISLVGIQVMDRLAHNVVPTTWDHYLVWAHSDNEAIVDALEEVGIPAVDVAGATFDWRADGTTTRAAIPWTASPYELTVRGSIQDAPHLHDNTFQHGPAPGAGPSLRLLIDPLVPRDRFCFSAVAADCGSIRVEDGTPMADLLDDASVFAAADHEVLSHAEIQVTIR